MALHDGSHRIFICLLPKNSSYWYRIFIKMPQYIGGIDFNRPSNLKHPTGLVVLTRSYLNSRAPLNREIRNNVRMSMSANRTQIM